MSRNRASAKKAGTAFETLVAGFLADRLDDDRIERRTKNGANDRGDITGVHHMGQRIVVEAKDYGGKLNAAQWITEAEIERGNDDAGVGIVVAKRRGTAAPQDQYVLMTLGDLANLLTGLKGAYDAS